MDNSWQSKCGSMWQSSTPSASPASHLKPEESRNQMLNAGYLFYPSVLQERSLAAHGMTQEPMFPVTSNLSFYNSGNAGLGTSFLSLLSGPPSLLQCDQHQLSSPKPFITSSKVPVSSSGAMVSASGNGVSLPPTGVLPQNPENRNLKTRVELSPFSSMPVASANYGSTSGLYDVLQAANVNIQNPELAKALVHQKAFGNEKVRDFSPVRGGWLANTVSTKVGKLHSTSTPVSRKVPLETNSSNSCQSSTGKSDCPRVVCVCTSGGLLISNKGLGVVCSCHGLHMSVAKFAEHSGLCDANPGYAVRLDSGETIAQWRKVYFQKFGVRVPEDYSGWDWPQGFSASAPLVKHSATIPNMSKNPDLSNLVGSSGALVGPEQPWNNTLFPKNHHTGQNLVTEVSPNEKQGNAQDSGNFLLKGLSGASQSDLQSVAVHRILESPMPGCSTMSKLVDTRGPDNGCWSISACIDSVKSGNSFISTPHFQNFKVPGKDSTVSRISNSREGNFVDRDAVSSNIELRLGQPSQQSQTLANPNLHAFRSHPNGINGEPQKSLFPQQLINNNNSRLMEECRQYIQCAADTSDSGARREQSQLNLLNPAFGVYTAIDAAKAEQVKGDAARSSVISKLLSHLKSHSEGKMHFKATNNAVNGSHVMPTKLHCDPHIAKCDPINFPCNRAVATESQFNVHDLGVQKHFEKGKRVGCATDGSHVAAESNFGFHPKYKENLSSHCGFMGTARHHNFSAVHTKSCHPCQFFGAPADASGFKNPSNYYGMISCLGRSGPFDHGLLTSISSAMESGTIFPSLAVSTGVSSATSVTVPNPTPASSNKERIGVSPCLLDDNLRQLALRHLLELSNQEHAIASLGTNHERGRVNDTSDENIPSPICDPLSLKEERHGSYLGSKQDASEVAVKTLQSGATYWMSSGNDKLAPVPDSNKWCGFSAFPQGASLHSKDIEMQCQLSHNHIPIEQPSLRLGRSESDISPTELRQFCQRIQYPYFPGRCSCAVKSNCLCEKFDSKGETSFSAFTERGSDGGRASILFPSKCEGGYTFPKDKAIPVGQSGKLKRQNTKKVEFHDFQWRDVPSKVTHMCNVNCKDQRGDLPDGRVNVEDQIADAAAANCCNRSAHNAESLKEQEMSNISSGCSAPVVTQVSVEVNTKDSCVVDAEDTRCANNLVVDEGSGIDKCWSSDDALDSERSAEFLGFSCKINSTSKQSSKAFPNQSSRSLIDELRLRDSLRSKKTQAPIHNGLIIHDKTKHLQKFEGGFKTGKRKRATKWKTLDASFPASGLCSAHDEPPKCGGSAEQHSYSSKDIQMLLRPDQERAHSRACSVGPSLKRRRSALSSFKNVSHKRHLHKLYYDREGEIDCRTQLRFNEDCVDAPEASGGKRFRLGCAAANKVLMQKPNSTDAETSAKCNSVDCMITSSSQQVNVSKRKVRPIVCGKYGVIISNGDLSKPAKILSLRKILKTARRCTFSENEKLRSISAKELKKAGIRGSNGCFNKYSDLKGVGDGECHNAATYGELDPNDSVEETETAHSPECKEHDDVPYMLEKGKCNRSEKNDTVPDSCLNTRLKPKCKEVRKRSLHELTIKGKDSSCATFSAVKNSECVPQTKCRYLGKFLKNVDNSKNRTSERYIAKKSNMENQCHSTSDLDAFCCVCGSSNKDEINYLLECNRCLIKVHQACYGVSKVPKTRWYCRPCRTSSKNIICVLCGYGGGAMTRALRTRNIVKSLLKAWNFVTESGPKNPVSSSETFEEQLNMSTSSRSGLKNDSFPVIRPACLESSSAAVWKMHLHKQVDSVKNLSYSPHNSTKHNSITAGVLDSTVKQWVHMVCGLWTPGTRCPNVDTMSAFDVSGASRPKVDMVCSMCNRPGGSCIRCRVVDCSVQFHPWCAHQKGLLQSEVEGIDNENVGFYGRCELHATQQCNSDIDPVGTETVHPREKELTCARTEGYKGRKREGFRHNLTCQSDCSGGCLVSQEQLNAWLHINGQKSCTKGLPKPPASDIEYDCRKEYARYKQSKGWKHLVVYKSGIHALGLYTSRFISRGAMVVEYVGEIVGLRVADKRESEYQSGRKLQYKSACYFFRIDKEHIIDATRKGGIARFVNHSCLPNCVAKVISVRNEKKVVFFAERDIYPGEEITYDYHFNHEDEGKKIPCFCNSKNCRRYLN